MGEIKVKIWGVRSAIPAPLNGSQYQARLREALVQARKTWRSKPDTPPEEIFEALPEEVRLLVGGETSCVEIRDGDRQLIVDMGTGARRLGYDMLARGQKGDIHILLTDTRWETIQGWPFFIPGFLPGNRVLFYSIYEDCRERFVRQQHFDHFPVEFENMLSKREFLYAAPGTERQIEGFRVEPIALEHGAAGFRLRAGDRTLLIVPPLFRSEADLERVTRQYASAFSGADLVLLAYQCFEFGDSRAAMAAAARCSSAWNAGRVVLIHHNPAEYDTGLRENFAKARALLNGKGPRIALAMEGEEYAL